MANVPYPNFVLENKITDLLNTKLNVRSIAKVDTSLAEAAGMIKKVNVYSYDGEVEKVAVGVGNTKTGEVTYTPKSYEVGVYQHRFAYFDEDIMTDPMILDAGLEGAATIMINHLNEQVFAEYDEAVLEVADVAALNYDAVVDAIALMNVEDESGIFLVIGIDHKADIRKDEDFKGARAGEILFNGQIGTIAGIPVIVSKMLNEKDAYVATKEAVTIFLKKAAEAEQDREANFRRNTAYLRRVGLVALTDATKIVRITAEPALDDGDEGEEEEEG